MLTKKQKQRTKSYHLFNNIDGFQKNQLLNIRPPRRAHVVASFKLLSRKELGKCMKKHFKSSFGKLLQK